MNYFLAGVLAASAFSAEPLPVSEQKVASALEARLQDRLDRLFGPGKSAVSVWVKIGADPRFLRALDGTPAGAGRFEWTWRGLVKKPFERFALPGIEDDSPRPTAQAPVPGEIAALLSASIKRIIVSARLDSALPTEADALAGELIAKTIDLDETRGDLVEIKRSAFPQPVKSPDGFPSAMLILIAAILSAAVGAAVFISERWLRRTVIPPPAAAAPILPLPEDLISRARSPFCIPPEDAAKLFFLLRHQSAEDVALLLPQLLPDTRKALLSFFSPEETARALEAGSEFRVVDPELIAMLRIEIERRVASLHGGPDVASRLLEDSPPEERGRIINALSLIKPSLASAIKGTPGGLER